MSDGKVKLQCPGCGASARGLPSFTEKPVKCPKCGKTVRFEIVEVDVVQAAAPSALPAAGRVCPTCGTEIPAGSNRCPKCIAAQAVVRDRIRTEDKGDFFEPERKALDKGVLGGLLLIVIAIVWFVAGLAADVIFYYPPVLLIIGIFGVFKGLATGNIAGKRKGRRRRQR